MTITKTPPPPPEPPPAPHYTLVLSEVEMHVLRGALYEQSSETTRAFLNKEEREIAGKMWRQIIDPSCNPPFNKEMKERIEKGER